MNMTPRIWESFCGNSWPIHQKQKNGDGSQVKGCFFDVFFGLAQLLHESV